MTPQDEAPKANPSDKKTPDEWCAELGLIKLGKKSKPNKDGSRIQITQDVPAWQHNAAGALHGWSLHAYHTGKPLLLTVADYKAALKAAEGPALKDGKVIDPKAEPYVPHKPAMSPHAPWAKKD
jgi:hypothetical protein